MTNKLSEEEVIDQAVNYLIPHAGTNPWVILFEGKPLKVYSGKSSWKRKNHAASALSNHFYGTFTKYRDGWEPGEVTKLLQEKGIIEIKQL
jgi:hypothetical protein